MNQKILSLVLLLVAIGCTTNPPSGRIEDARSAFSAYIVDFWTHRDTSAIGRAFSPEIVYHYNGQTQKADYASHFRALRGFGRAFPDLIGAIDVFTFDGTFGAAVTSWTGTHLDTLSGVQATGMHAIPPTGQKISWPVNYVFRMQNNRIAELWEVWDEGNVYLRLWNAVPRPKS